MKSMQWGQSQTETLEHNARCKVAHHVAHTQNAKAQ